MRIEYTRLREAMEKTLTAHGLLPARARLLAGELADATFAGYESHGIGRMASYVLALREGTLRADARLETVRETAATALLDGGLGPGILMALEAAEVVSAKARQLGIGAVSLRNCGDVARLAPYAERIALGGAIGIVTANDAGSGLVVAPHGGNQPLLSTNPIAAGIPRRNARPLVFDFATSQVALGAVRAAARRGGPVPGDTLIDAGGEPITAPEALFSELAALLPLGGSAFGFKGTALGLLVDILAGGLSGDGLSGSWPDRRGRNALFLAAIQPEAFGDPETFHAGLEALLTRIRTSRPRPGFASVRVPGEHGAAPGSEQYTEVLDTLWEELTALRTRG